MLRTARSAWDRLGLLPRLVVFFLGVGVVLLLGALLLKWVPEWLATDGLTGKDRAEDVSRARTAVLATIAGLIATIGAVFTGLTYRLNQQSHELDRAGQITERFTRAIDQLGNESLDVRLGGIYALERIARDSSEDHPQVVEVLAAFVRQRSERPSTAAEQQTAAAKPQTSTVGESPPLDILVAQEPPARPIRADVQAAMTVLGRRDVSRDWHGTSLNLRNAYLIGLQLVAQPGRPGPHFERADLSGANLTRAILHGVRFDGAAFIGTTFDAARLSECHFEGALFVATNLGRAVLYENSPTYLDGADLSHAILDGARLASARYDEYTRWPEGFQPPANSAESGES